MKKLTVYLVLMGVAIALVAVPAQAAPLSYSFEVTATSGTLNGTTSTGTFAFDDSIIPSGGGTVRGNNLLTDLSFTWNSFVYDEHNANTGSLQFDASGELIYPVFGNNCPPGFCIVNRGIEQWFVAGDYFVYSVTGGEIEDGTFSFKPVAAVPEPTTMLLLGLGLVGLAGVRRKLKQ
jgi:hypothetical protein